MITKATGRKIGRFLLIICVLYLLYVFLTGVFPFLGRKEVSEDFATSIKTSDFYGETVCTDRVALIEQPSDGFYTRLHILDEAKERVDVSYYAMHMGETTDLFLGALLDAADRGVHVRILVDGLFGGLTDANRVYAVALGAHPNIEVALYNPPSLLKPWTWNGRLHDKYIIVDDRLLLLGGRNIGDKYFAPEGYEKKISYDRDVLVYNTAWQHGENESVLHDVRRYMDALWNSSDVRQSFEKETRRGAEKQKELLRTYRLFAAEHTEIVDHASDDYEGQTYAANRVTFFHNDTQIGLKEPKAGYILSQLLLDAEDSVTMQSPYIVREPVLDDLLDTLDEKELDMTLLTNSVASSPNPMACTAYWGDRASLLTHDVRLWEYQGKDQLHAKSYLIDDRMAVVGSYNLDPRSAYLDTELMLAIDSPAFTQHLREVQGEYLRQALEVGSDGQYVPNSGVTECPIPPLKRVMLYALYLPVKLFQNLI